MIEELLPASVAVVSGRFWARLLLPGLLVGGRRVEAFDGRWTVHRDLLATAVVVHHF